MAKSLAQACEAEKASKKYPVARIACISFPPQPFAWVPVSGGKVHVRWLFRQAAHSVPLTSVRSHPEHAEALLLDRRIERRRYRQPEDAARIGRIDDAVVPEACAGIVRIALTLVLIADRRLERLLVFLAPGFARGLEATAAHGREHARGLFAAHDADARVRP